MQAQQLFTYHHHAECSALWSEVKCISSAIYIFVTALARVK